ncbi:MAG TPA: SpoIID/LytB domain-containing protein [Gaiellaceae bacterium]|nr:SpoIID/LytB domain-containing protein [Gaiellaceae bacterium]
MSSCPRHAITLFVCAVCCSTVTATAATPTSATAPVVIVGHGLGHGIGLSQWGAEVRAGAGQTTAQILRFYYPHTTLGRAGAAAFAPVRVLVAEAPAFKTGARGSFRARDARGRTVMLSGLQTATAHSFGSTHLAFPIELTPDARHLRVGGLPYAGSIRLVRHGALVDAVNIVSVEDYVRGVVSAENPAYWHPAALRAQAIAARSYVLAHRRARASYDVFPDDRSQNYRGLARSFPTTRRAVSATAGKVLRYRGRIADAMFSASNGGLTSAGPAPYLVKRLDPFDARSPAADWGPVTVSARRLASALPGLPAPVTALAFTYNTSQRVAGVTLELGNGASQQLSGFEFQQRLGLRSTYFELATHPS